jgi:hypothetical protein
MVRACWAAAGSTRHFNQSAFLLVSYLSFFTCNGSVESDDFLHHLQTRAVQLNFGFGQLGGGDADVRIIPERFGQHLLQLRLFRQFFWLLLFFWLFGILLLLLFWQLGSRRERLMLLCQRNANASQHKRQGQRSNHLASHIFSPSVGHF